MLWEVKIQTQYNCTKDFIKEWPLKIAKLVLAFIAREGQIKGQWPVYLVPIACCCVSLNLKSSIRSRPLIQVYPIRGWTIQANSQPPYQENCTLLRLMGFLEWHWIYKRIAPKSLTKTSTMIFFIHVRGHSITQWTKRILSM